jgi:hypothetical protein
MIAEACRKEVDIISIWKSNTKVKSNRLGRFIIMTPLPVNNAMVCISDVIEVGNEETGN